MKVIVNPVFEFVFQGVHVATAQTTLAGTCSNFDLQMAALKATKLRVFVLFTTIRDARCIAAAAQRAGLWGPGYFWMGIVSLGLSVFFLFQSSLLLVPVDSIISLTSTSTLLAGGSGMMDPAIWNDAQGNLDPKNYNLFQRLVGILPR
jgi:hypothetical protein